MMEAAHKITCICPYHRYTAYAFAALYPPLMAFMVSAPLFDFLADTLRNEALLLSAYFIICFARVTVKTVIYLAVMLPLSTVALMFAGCMRSLCH